MPRRPDIPSFEAPERAAIAAFLDKALSRARAMFTQIAADATAFHAGASPNSLSSPAMHSSRGDKPRGQVARISARRIEKAR